MAYTAPKWTQMTAPSGTTSVNALTSAGDLFSKAMDSASEGLKSYDKGVESRLQEDSDVNTAALRRRLESATDLDSLNAMQGDISATGLEGYGKRIDADALNQSFDKERGVLRGEFQQEFNENFSQRMAESETPEDFATRQAELTQANKDNSFLDISGQITSVASAAKSAKEKRNNENNIRIKYFSSLYGHVHEKLTKCPWHLDFCNSCLSSSGNISWIVKFQEIFFIESHIQ